MFHLFRGFMLWKSLEPVRGCVNDLSPFGIGVIFALISWVFQYCFFPEVLLPYFMGPSFLLGAFLAEGVQKC